MSLADRYFEGLEELMTDEQLEKFEIIPPATEDEISRLEKFYPDCPESLLDLWRTKRGTYHEEIDDVYILIPVLSSDVEGGEYPYYLKSCVQILEEAKKNYNKQSIEEIYGEEWIKENSEDFDKRIKMNISHNKWLNFADCINNGGTSQLFIDFDPADKGVKGQIIRYLHDPDSYAVIADSFDEYLKNIIGEEYPFSYIYEDWDD